MMDLNVATFMHGEYLDAVRAKPPLMRLAHWIKEREAIRERRANGERAPWSKDPILRTYRFCNVHREDDRVTRWIDDNWRKPNAYNPHMWHAMIIARLLNWPITLGRMGWPEPWPKRKVRVAQVLGEMQKSNEKIFTGAYIVSTNGIATDKVSYVLQTFDRAWQSEDEPTPNDTLADAHKKLMAMHGMGSFMAAQVVADLKHTPYLANAPDWWDWCAPGPGSLRGLARVKLASCNVMERVTTNLFPKAGFVDELITLRKQLTRHTAIAEKLCLQDLQNCLCEFDKYERVLWNQGRPRATFRPTVE
jgi:hypothetical protein